MKSDSEAALKEILETIHLGHGRDWLIYQIKNPSDWFYVRPGSTTDKRIVSIIVERMGESWALDQINAHAKS